MNIKIKAIHGNWDLGFTLDKHMVSSTYIGDNEHGHPQFDSVRTEIGEALFQLKYRSAFRHIPLIGEQLHVSLGSEYPSAAVIIPMPPSKKRRRQPVVEIGKDFATRMKIPFIPNLLIKSAVTDQIKDIANRDERVKILKAAFSINDVLSQGPHDVLIVDDLFDTGSSLEAATHVLKTHSKIRKVFAAVVTRKSNV